MKLHERMPGGGQSLWTVIPDAGEAGKPALVMAPKRALPKYSQELELAIHLFV